MQEFTAGMILTQLQKRVSKTNAKLLLDTAKTQSGVIVENDLALDKEQAMALCMRMINQGGPSFQVGQAVYKQFLV